MQTLYINECKLYTHINHLLLKYLEILIVITATLKGVIIDTIYNKIKNTISLLYFNNILIVYNSI